MVSTTTADQKRCAITVSIDGYPSPDPEEYEKIKQFLMHPDEKSSPEKIIVVGNDKFVTLDMYVEICDGPQKITIPKQYLEYSLWGKTEIKRSGDMIGEIEETIKIYLSPNTHKKDTLWATLELSVQYIENLVKEMIFPLEVGSFTGAGTLALDGVSIKGTDKIMKGFECDESPTNWAATYARTGFVKGWPSEVVSWPPP